VCILSSVVGGSGGFVTREVRFPCKKKTSRKGREVKRSKYRAMVIGDIPLQDKIGVDI
jgi:hypothetical protein